MNAATWCLEYNVMWMWCWQTAVKPKQQPSATVCKRALCVWPSLVSRLHHLHLLTELWQVRPTRETLTACMSRVFKSLFGGIVFLQVRTVSLIMFLLVHSAFGSLFVLLSPYLYVCSVSLLCVSIALQLNVTSGIFWWLIEWCAGFISST